MIDPTGHRVHYDPNDPPEPCPECEGSGFHPAEIPGRACPACHGSGLANLPEIVDDARELLPPIGSVVALRDWMAGQALAGMMAYSMDWTRGADVLAEAAEKAYRVADAMLSARSR